MPDTVTPPMYWDEEVGGVEEHARKIALVTEQILLGKTNNTREVTLDSNATSTLIEDSRISVDTVIQLSPKTQSAATAMAAGVIYYEANKAELTIHHDSQPDEDRTFGAVLVG